VKCAVIFTITLVLLLILDGMVAMIFYLFHEDCPWPNALARPRTSDVCYAKLG
jgi:hypothetical protein